jgi:anaphase-promoting complex subunit 3
MREACDRQARNSGTFDLTGGIELDKHSDTTRRSQPDAAAVYCLMAKLWHAHGDTKKAVECYVEALKLNPFMWDAFLGLCDTGGLSDIPD